MALKPEEIKFVKNVKPKTAGTLAYGEWQFGSVFNLEFSGRPNVENLGLKVGDVVLLYQTVEGRGLLLTHLVRLESIDAVEIRKHKDYPYQLKVKIVGKIPDGIERDVTSLVDALDFRGIAVTGNLVGIKSAVEKKMADILNVDEVQRRILAVFEREGSVEK